MRNFRRSYYDRVCRSEFHEPSHLLADVAKQPGSGIRPLPVQRTLGKPDSFGDFLIAQAAEEFQHDYALKFGIFELEARQGLASPHYRPASSRGTK